MAQTSLSAPDGSPLAEVAQRAALGARCHFVVYGHPEPQGSKKGYLVGKHVNIVDDNKDKLYPWREHVGAEAQAQLPEGWQMIDGPVFMALTFYRHRGDTSYLADGVTLSAAAKRRDYPDAKPDTNKLGRAVEDALSKIVYFEDGRIVTSVSTKRWTVRRRDGVASATADEMVPGWSGIIRDRERVVVEVVAL